MKRRSLTVFTVAFTVVLIAGVALAQVGTFSAGSGEPVAMFDAGSEVTVPTGDDHVRDGTGGPEVDEPEHRSDVPKTDEGLDADEAKAEADEPETDGTKAEAEEPEADEPEADEPEHQSDDDHEADEPAATGPEFSIGYPENEMRFDRAVVVFEGSVEPGATVHRGKYRAEVNGDGWRIELVLAPGKNVVSFLAVDETGNETERSVTVFYDAPAADEGDGKGEEPPAAEVDFEAYQTYGSCSEPVPYDVFYGRATPGATVWIESPYGSAQKTANDRGKWEAKVTFPEAPFNEPFNVVVESSDGGRAVFSFVRTGAEHEG